MREMKVGMISNVLKALKNRRLAAILKFRGRIARSGAIYFNGEHEENGAEPLVRVAQPGDIDEVVKLCAEHASSKRRKFSPEGQSEPPAQRPLSSLPRLGVSWPKLAVHRWVRRFVLRIIRLGGQRLPAYGLPIP